MPKIGPTITTLMKHAPRPGGCKCGWRGVDLVGHVEPILMRELQAKGLDPDTVRPAQ